jgi:hypothetical protein
LESFKLDSRLGYLAIQQVTMAAAVSESFLAAIAVAQLQQSLKVKMVVSFLLAELQGFQILVGCFFSSCVL